MTNSSINTALPSQARFILLLASFNMALVVMLGAFAAHSLKQSLSTALLNTFQTAVHYHALHALGLLGLGVLALFWPSPWLKRSAWALLIGIFLFSGSLYALSTTGLRMLGMITPLGGVAFILGWSFLFFGLWQDNRINSEQSS